MRRRPAAGFTKKTVFVLAAFGALFYWSWQSIGVDVMAAISPRLREAFAAEFSAGQQLHAGAGWDRCLKYGARWLNACQPGDNECRALRKRRIEGCISGAQTRPCINLREVFGGRLPDKEEYCRKAETGFGAGPACIDAAAVIVSMCRR